VAPANPVIDVRLRSSERKSAAAARTFAPVAKPEFPIKARILAGKMLKNFSFVDTSARVRTIVSRAVEGSTYESSSREEAGRLVINTRRADGARVHIRFLGVRDSESSTLP